MTRYGVVVALALVALTCGTPYAAAERVRLHVPGSLQPVYLECRSGNLLHLLGPVPNGSDATSLGRAVALIAEAATGEAEILSGRIEEVDGRLGFAVQVEANSPVLANLANEQPVRIWRQTREITVPGQDSGGAIRALVRSCRTAAPDNPGTARPGQGYRVVPENLTLSGDRRWIVLASREQPDEAFEVAEEYRSKFSRIQVVRSSNGRYAVVAGPERIASPSEYKQQLMNSGRAPSDTFFSRGDKLIGRVLKSR